MAQEISDGNTNFLGGQDFSKEPDKIAPNAFSSGINVTTEDGCLGPRWGLEDKELDFQNAGGFDVAPFQQRSYKTIFKRGRIQAIIPYSVGSQYYLIYIVSGVIYLINQSTFNVTVMDITDGSFLDDNTPRINWSPANDYLVIFDFPSRPVIIDNFVARRADPALDEVPISTFGVYNQNRLFVANGLNEFTASDPTGIGFPNAPISFEEFFQPSTGYTGQSFQISTNYANDPITTMVFLQAVDSSTGIGTLLVATQNGVWAYPAQNPRASWEAGQFGSNILFNNGIVGSKSVVNVNSDLFFMSNDGQIRSLSMSRQEQGKWSKVPMSREIKNWLKVNDPSLMKYTVMSYFENKLFITANPYYVNAEGRLGNALMDVNFAGFAVLEMDNISNMAQTSSPVWAGLWNGIHPVDTAVNNKEMFVACRENGENKLYKFTPTKTIDIVDGVERPIKSRVYTKLFEFESPNNDKTLQSFEVNLSNIKGTFKSTVRYRNGLNLPFINWRDITYKAPYKICTVPTVSEINGLNSHTLPVVNYGSPEEYGCNEATQESYIKFRKMQFLLDFEGRSWKLNQLILRATVEAQDSHINVCNFYQDIKIPNQCLNDWNLYGNSLCP